MIALHALLSGTPGPLPAAAAEPLGLIAVAAVAATVGGVAAAFRAHSVAREAKTALARVAEHDLLTDLPNHALARAALVDHVAAGRGGLVLLELDRFATVNESYGHEVGDRLLRSLTEQLEHLVAPDEMLARWGGPQFALVIPGATTSGGLDARAATLQDALSAKVRIGHDTLWVTATVGAVAIDDRFTGVDDVVEAAATALGVARTEGRGGRRTFDRTMTSPIHSGTTDDQIARALADEQLWVLYEPVVSMAERRVVGVEARLHWADPQRGMIGPEELEEVLVRSGLEAVVAERTLGQVLAQAAQWHRDHPSLAVTVAVPPSLLTQEGFTARFAAMVRDSGADTDELCIEVAGRSRADLFDLWAPLREVSSLGVQVALDEFGTGWSSLAYLRRFSIDVLKIAPAFVGTITSSRADEAVVQQVIGLANALELVPIAEGVTTKAQADLLTSLGCELGQGPWFGLPMPLTGIEAVLARGKVEPGGRSSAGIDWTAPTR